MKRIVRYMVILSFFAVVVFLCIFKVVNFDFGWHLKTGEYIWTTKSIPRQDMFSYIAQGNKWVDSHWLFQAIIYLFYALDGITGVIILRILAVLATFCLLLFTIYRKEYNNLSVFVCIIALFVSFQRFLVRPEIFSLLFLASFFYFSERFSRRPLLSLIVIPLCQLLWVNMHGLHVLGVLFLFLYLLGDLLQQILCKYLTFLYRPDISIREWKQRGLLFGLTSLALLLNANGKEGILYPYKIFTELKTKTSVFSQVTELISPFKVKNVPFPDPSIVYKILLVLSAFVLIAQLKKIRLAHLLPYGAFLYISALAVRNMPLFAVVATPVTINSLYGIMDFIKGKNRKWASIGHYCYYTASILLIAFSIAACIFIANNKMYQRLGYLRAFGFGEADTYPAEAVEYLKGRNIQGNIFNSSEIGGYMIWKMYPEKQVALDGRWEVYGDFLNNLQGLRYQLYFEQLAARYNIQSIILHKRSLEVYLMGPWLQNNPRWRLVLNTNNAIVYERGF